MAVAPPFVNLRCWWEDFRQESPGLPVPPADSVQERPLGQRHSDSCVHEPNPAKMTPPRRQIGWPKASSFNIA